MTDPANDRSQQPERRQPGRRRHRRAVDPGRGPEQVWHSSLWEDDDRAWGERNADDDERILRERPPHWD